jgi:hypothetical protein
MVQLAVGYCYPQPYGLMKTLYPRNVLEDGQKNLRKRMDDVGSVQLLLIRGGQSTLSHVTSVMNCLYVGVFSTFSITISAFFLYLFYLPAICAF